MADITIKQGPKTLKIATIATARLPLHALLHQNGGADEISVAALSGQLADDQNAKALRSATTLVDVSAAAAPTAGQVLTALSPALADWQTPAVGGAATKEKFFYFVAQAGTSTQSLGDHIVLNVGASSGARFNFNVPHDFTSLTDLVLMAIPTAGSAGAGKGIDLFSDYGAVGESRTNHSESNTTITFDLTGTAEQHAEIDISSVFSVLAANDRCAIRFIHNAVGGAINYLGVRLRYN